ncbi:MAG: hypothetical protein JXJ04_15770 [Spirochaetales bacterium]|nr:hypothetical protein [Spirochaetales bacterium]
MNKNVLFFSGIVFMIFSAWVIYKFFKTYRRSVMQKIITMCILFVVVISLLNCVSTPPRPETPAKEGYEWRYNTRKAAWEEISKEELAQKEAEKQAKLQKQREMAGVITKITADDIFNNPGQYKGQQVVLTLAGSMEFIKFAGGKYRATVSPGGGRMFILHAFDSDYAFAQNNLKKFQEEYSLTGFEMGASSAAHYINSASRTIQGLVVNYGDFSQTDLVTGEKKQYKSIEIQMVTIF